MAFGTVVVAWRNARFSRLARQRIEFASGASEPSAVQSHVARSHLVRHRVLPWLAGGSAAIILYFTLGWGSAFPLAVGLIVSLLGGQLEAYLAGQRSAKIETQLVEAIDLMVGALGAGAGVTDALENATRESQRPLRPQLEDMIGRIRLGDDPPTVYHGLAERVPLETFLLFASALSVHWETGGSLAPTLAGVGRTIRDRIEIARRIHSNAAQSQMSTIAVMLLTYFIAVVMWRTNPEQMRAFLATSGGQWAVAGTIVLQAVGLVWMSAISRLKF